MVKLKNQINAEFSKKDIPAKLSINNGVYVLRVYGDRGFYLEDIYRPWNQDHMKFLRTVVLKCNDLHELVHALEL